MFRAYSRPSSGVPPPAHYELTNPEADHGSKALPQCLPGALTPLDCRNNFTYK